MITVCDQLEAMTAIADSLQEAANALTDALKRMAEWQPATHDEQANELDVSTAKEMILDEIGALQALVTDLRHQEDTINTQRLRVRDLAALRRIHGEGYGGTSD